MSSLKTSSNRLPWQALVLALVIVVLAAAAGIAAVLLVIFPAAALLIGYFLPDWIAIIPVFGKMSALHAAWAIAAGVGLAVLLTQLALWLSRRRALLQWLGRRR